MCDGTCTQIDEARKYETELVDLSRRKKRVQHINAVVTHLLLQQLLMQIQHLLLQLRYSRLKVTQKPDEAIRVSADVWIINSIHKLSTKEKNKLLSNLPTQAHINANSAVTYLLRQ